MIIFYKLHGCYKQGRMYNESLLIYNDVENEEDTSIASIQMLYVTLKLAYMKKMFVYSLFFVFSSCGNNNSQPKEKDPKETQTSLSNNSDSLTKGIPNQLIDSANLLQIDKLIKHGMPILLTEARQILGNQVRIDTAKHELDFDNYTWNLDNGTTLRFEDINYNEKGIELDRLRFTSKNIIEYPSGIFLNKSTLDECKKAFPNLKKSYENKTFKFEKDKTWYFLIFGNDNILIEIKSSGWDTDMSG